MKKFFVFILIISSFLCSISADAIFVKKALAAHEQTSGTNKIAIVIDDFGGYERGGIQELLFSSVPITCAIMPFVDNSEADYNQAVAAGKEVILHMPMQAHVGLPESWYGPVYIKNHDSKETATQKLDKCFATMPQAKGFNIHIGSGASRNAELMQAMYEYANAHNMLFLDSRTNSGDKCEEVSKQTGSIYLGRDVFLEPHKNRSYVGVMNRLHEAQKIAEEKGYAIVIGHVGAEGGINTARAIIDFAQNLNSTTEIVPLSTMYDIIKQSSYK